MSQRTVGIVMDRLLADEPLRRRFEEDPVETVGELLADGVELSPSEIDLFVQSSLLTKPHIDSGKLIGLGTTSTERWDRLPNVPTLGESGPPELRGFSYKSWMGTATSAGV